VVSHAVNWFVLLPVCLQFAVTPDTPPLRPQQHAGYFRPAGPGQIRFYTNTSPARGFVLNTLASDAQRVVTFDETAETEDSEAIPFSDSLVAERLRPPFWLTALAALVTTVLQHLRAANLAGTIPWLFAAAPCLPLSALAVTTHLSRRRFVNMGRVVTDFLLIIGVNIAWLHFDLDTFARPVRDSFITLIAPAAHPPFVGSVQKVTPFITLAAVNLLLALALYCRGFVGTRQKNRMEGLP
jgi:hypothetical protein